MLKVGELAALANLTVRTLHHYDDIGLLRPSARSDAGYRLYGRDDVARLHRIQVLRTMGMNLADIALALDRPDGSPLAVVDRQLAELDQRIADATRLRDQLLRVRTQLAHGDAPSMSTWLTTLEMTMDRLKIYEKYLTPEEMARLPMAHDAAVEREYQLLIEQGIGLLRSEVPPSAEGARAFAMRWLQAFERGTAGDPELMAKLNVMAIRDGETAGVPQEVKDYAFAAIGELKQAAWAKHLRPEILARMRRHHAARGREWPALIQRVHEQARLDPDATSERSLEVVRAWADLSADMIGTDPADLAAFRTANQQEAVLRMGSGIDGPALAWLPKAFAQLAVSRAAAPDADARRPAPPPGSTTDTAR